MTTTTQLIYWSRTTPGEDPSKVDLRELLAAARAHNARTAITGALISGPDYFAQVLEGPPEVVHPLFERIQQDTRHHDVLALPERAVTERTFPDWSMGFAANENSEQVVQTRDNAYAARDETAALETLDLIQESIAKVQLW
jgi:hypothetical protein